MTDLTFDPAALRALQDRARRLVSWQSRIDMLQRYDGLESALAAARVELAEAKRERDAAFEHGLVTASMGPAERDRLHRTIKGLRAELDAMTGATAPQADPYPLVSQDFRDAVAKTAAERWPDKYGAAAVPGDGEQAATTCPACGHGINWHWDDNGQRDGAPGCHEGDCACSNTRASVNRLTATALPTSGQA